MEKNVSKKISEYTNNYKDNLSIWIKDNNITLTDNNNKDRTSEFIQYLLDFPNLELSLDDFKKRKRIKNTIPDYERCIALKCNGDRCSRKKKKNNFCGTHFKGPPYGTTNNEDKTKPLTDEKLASLLKEKGYLIARRTVAKYREQLNIPVARLRKELL